MNATHIIPYAHVANVKKSIQFYEILGLSCLNKMGPVHEPFWAHMYCGETRLMLARASSPIDAEVQAVLFYIYSSDISSMRQHLLDSGLTDGGYYNGQAYVKSEFGTVFEKSIPHYMPAGEIRVHDPDGYVLLIGQRD